MTSASTDLVMSRTPSIRDVSGHWASGRDVLRATERLFLKRCVHQQIDGRHWPVTGDEALAEIAQKVVGACLRLRGYQATARVCESGLHLETWKCLENCGHVH